MTTRKKLFYTLGIIVAVVILIEGMFLLIDGRFWRPILEYNTDEVIKPITVRQSSGANLLIAECGDKNYISNKSDYIIEGIVENVESKWNEDKSLIFTYTNISIKKYVKGTPFKIVSPQLQIITPGGTVGEITQAVEDQPIFHKGKAVRIYIKNYNGEFSIVCGQMGVEEIVEITPFFPVANKPSEDSMTALLEGELSLEDGCLRVSDRGYDNYLLVWPYGFSLSTEGGVIQIIDDTGQPIADVGGRVKIGGGECAKPCEGIAKYSAQLPSDRCSGPYWIVGEVITDNESNN
jgi:hypothetical protein